MQSPGIRSPAALDSQALPALTGVRFLAAAGVVLHHFPSILPESWARQPAVAQTLGKGYLGVTLFFMLSGFLLAVVYRQRMESLRDCREFLVARFARLYPVYLVSLAMTYKLFFGRGGQHFHLSRGIQVLLLTQSWHIHNHRMAGYWNFVAWTLSIEAFFYLCFPVLLRGLRLCSSKALLAWLACLAAICVLALVPDQRYLALQPEAGYPLPFALMRLPEFILGLILGLLHARHPAASPGRMLAYAGCAGSAILLAAPTHGWNSLIVLPMAALLYGLASPDTVLARALATPWMLALGRISYAMYLLQLAVHFELEHVVRRLCPALLPWTPQLMFPLLLAVSFAVYRLWEQPCRRGIRAGSRWLDAEIARWRKTVRNRRGREAFAGRLGSVLAAAEAVRKL